MRYIVTFLGILLAQSSFCQVDSLKQIIHSNSDPNTRLTATDLLVKQLAFKQPDSALRYGLDGFELALETDTTIAASISLNIGTSYYAKGDYEGALKFWQQAADLSGLTEKQLIKPLALNNVAIIYQNTGRIKEAIGNFTEAIEIYKERKDTIRVGRGTFNIAKAYLALGEDSIGIYHLKKSISIYEQVGRKALKNLANAYNDLASVHYYDSEYLEALENYQQSIRFYLEAGDTLGSLKPKGNIGNIHRALKNNSEALTIYQEVIATKEKFDQFSVHFNYHNLGEALADSERYDEALLNYRKALSLRENAGLKGLSVSTMIGMADIFKETRRLDSAKMYYSLLYKNSIGLDDAEYRTSGICSYCGWMMYQGRTEDALLLAKDCYQEATEINARSQIVKAASWLQEIYESKEDFENAYLYLSEVNQLSDSLFNADLIREITNKEAVFQNEKEILKRENEIKLLESKEQVAALQITFLVIGIVLIVLVAFLISRMMIMKRERRRRELEAISKFRESMTGMIAHDLKTPLSVIMNSSTDETNKQMTGQMLRLINNMLDVHKFENTEVKLALKQCQVSDIIEPAITQIKYLVEEKNLKMTLQLENVTLSVDIEVMVRVIVNLLTNAIKYSPLNGEIKINTHVAGSNAIISIGDVGPGIPKEQLETIFESFEQVDPQPSGGIGSTGLGLTFVKLAVEAHGFRVAVSSAVGEGTVFTIEAPVIEEARGDQVKAGENEKISLTVEEQAAIAEHLAQLKRLNVYQIGEIEKELSTLKDKEHVEEWVDAVLNAAYAGNKERYLELLGEV